MSVPVYHESQVYEDNVSSASSVESHNCPSPETMRLVNQLGPNGLNAPRHEKPKHIDSKNSGII